MKLVSIVVPTYNEADHIREFLDGLESSLQGLDYEVVVVDDNSPDGTHARVLAYAKTHARVFPVLRTREKGLAMAVIEGMRRATGTYVVVMDSDFQHPFTTARKLVETALEQQADMVVASRYVPGGGVVGFPPLRRLISWGARMLAILGLPTVRHHRVTDPVSGFFLVRRAKVPLERLKPRGYKILLEVLARSPLEKVVEVGYVFETRRGGESKLRLGTQKDYVLHVLQLAAHDRENRRLALFSIVGFSGILVHLAVLSGLMEGLGWQERWFWATYDVGALLAAILAREVAILWNFGWNDRITFRDKRRHAHARFFHRGFRFHIVSIWAFLAYLVVYYPLYLIDWDYRLAAVVAILASFALNYAGNLRWTYARRSDARHG